MLRETHSFITGSLWLKLKKDAADMRVLNTPDLFAAATHHVRTKLFTSAGWTCHALCPPNQFIPELILQRREAFQALIRFDFIPRPGITDRFPNDRLDSLLISLRHRLEKWSPKSDGAAYLIGLFDTEEHWLYPDEKDWEHQSCYWLPINCRSFPDYENWRARFDRLARSPLFKLSAP